MIATPIQVASIASEQLRKVNPQVQVADWLNSCTHLTHCCRGLAPKTLNGLKSGTVESLSPECLLDISSESTGLLQGLSSESLASIQPAAVKRFGKEQWLRLPPNLCSAISQQQAAAIATNPQPFCEALRPSCALILQRQPFDVFTFLVHVCLGKDVAPLPSDPNAGAKTSSGTATVVASGLLAEDTKDIVLTVLCSSSCAEYQRLVLCETHRPKRASQGAWVDPCSGQTPAMRPRHSAVVVGPDGTVERSTISPSAADSPAAEGSSSTLLVLLLVLALVLAYVIRARRQAVQNTYGHISGLRSQREGHHIGAVVGHFWGVHAKPNPATPASPPKSVAERWASRGYSHIGDDQEELEQREEV